MIAPSLLAADFAKLNEQIGMLNQSECDWLHYDVMDGVFVPNITFGLPVLKAVVALSQKPVDVHLMIVEPEKYVQAFADAGAASISVHIEASPHLHRTLGLIRETGCLVGVAFNPHTSIFALEEIIPEIDFVNVMSVNPGFGGQKFIHQSLEKIRKLRGLINSINPAVKIEVDGGVDGVLAPQLAECGADILVAGSAVFKAANPIQAIKQLKEGKLA